MEKRTKPIWIQPENDYQLPNIKLFNSLTNQKEVFKPNAGNRIEWYSCGPTVYDSSHMGHARAYISIDILRRVMQNYFKFDIHYVMNITDVDDKIIKRARQNHLFTNYIAESHDSSLIATDVERTLKHVESKLAKETDDDKKQMLQNDIRAIEQVLLRDRTDITSESLATIKDPFSDLLDREKGSSVVDNEIFEDLPRFYERDFLEDMASLNVLPPDELTRVSEYIAKIIAFVEQIIAKGFAYESNGSVYFDTERFDGCEDHYYAKLVPNAYGNESLLREGEGALTTFEAGEKRSDTDFALWKASKPGEPSWASPWGAGRPGWHIECSAMAGDKCGPRLDIHTGGIDLKFPHHDNEIAQSEAYFSCRQWVNFFLHTGHLTISGCKMSKSLKNFITIKTALGRHSARQLRLVFLLHAWTGTLDYSADTMAAALSFEKLVLDFFFNVRHACKLAARRPRTDIVSVDDEQLAAALERARQAVLEALSDSIDTREAMYALRDLIDIGNNHYAKIGPASSNARRLREMATYVYEILHMFGAADDCDEFGLIRYSERDLGGLMTQSVAVARRFVSAVERCADDTNRDTATALIAAFTDRCRTDFHLDVSAAADYRVDQCTRALLDDFLDALAEFRQSVRSVSIKHKWRLFLAECDLVRDSELASIGVRLQDIAGDCAAAIGLMPVSVAVVATNGGPQLKAAAGKQQHKKPPGGHGVAVGDKNKKIDASVEPHRMFSEGQYEGQFSLFDADGLPTHDAAGDELSKTRRGKLKKLMAEQKKQYEKFVAQ